MDYDVRATSGEMEVNWWSVGKAKAKGSTDCNLRYGIKEARPAHATIK